MRDALTIRRFGAGLLSLVPLLALASSRGRGVATGAPAPAAASMPDTIALPTPGDSITQVAMRNVGFHLDDQIVLRIAYLDGTMRSLHRGRPIVFDDKRSFVIHIDHARVGLTANDLSLLLNRYVFGYEGSPLRNLRITTAGTRIVQTGTLHKGVDIPFRITAEVSVTPDGHLRLHPVDTRIFNVDGDALMRALGIQLDKLLDLSGATGASVKGNDIYLAPDSILPPPAIEGRVTGVRVEGDQVVQLFGDSTARSGTSDSALPLPDPDARNYMYYRGGTLQFGKLVMLDADLQIADRDSSDLFDFDIDHYLVQLVAGYSRTLPTGALLVQMPDFDEAERMLSRAQEGAAAEGRRKGSSREP